MRPWWKVWVRTALELGLFVAWLGYEQEWAKNLILALFWVTIGLIALTAFLHEEDIDVPPPPPGSVWQRYILRSLHVGEGLVVVGLGYLVTGSIFILALMFLWFRIDRQRRVDQG